MPLSVVAMCFGTYMPSVAFFVLRPRLHVQRAGPSACVPVFESSQFVSLPSIHIYGEILTREGYDESNR